MTKAARRFEVFIGAGKRRNGSDAQKTSIVAECWPRCDRVSVVARRHALDPSQKLRWRKELVRRCKDHGVAVPVALEQQDPAFAAVMIAALIQNCKLTGINPHTWLTATRTSLVNGHPVSRIDELLPHAHVA